MTLSEEHEGTRKLALAAYNAQALDPEDYDFIEQNPERAEEVLEFTRWLAGSPAPEETS